MWYVSRLGSTSGQGISFERSWHPVLVRAQTYVTAVGEPESCHTTRSMPEALFNIKFGAHVVPADLIPTPARLCMVANLLLTADLEDAL